MRSIIWGVLCVGTGIAAAQQDAPSRPTFYRDILPLFQTHCQECHRPAGTNYGGMVAPMALTTYEDTRPWAKAIARAVSNRDMPPWAADPAFDGVFKNERVLPPDAVDTIVRWVETGAPRGSERDAPPQPVFENAGGWMIGEPDLVVAMPEPYVVGDDVADLYTAFTVDLTEEQLPGDRWITAFQCKPGSDIIHHFNAHLLAPDENGKLPPPPSAPESKDIAPRGAGQYIGGVSSGTDAVAFPEGFGLLIKKGTRVTFDIHYHKQPGPGTGRTDLSHIGFRLSDTPPQREIGGAAPILWFGIDIAPGEKDYQIGPIAQTLKEPIDIVSLMPHMHMRGSRAKFEAFYPDGTNEVLLSVPRYDFAWQTVYYFKDLKRVPEGTRIEFTAWYDNSPEMAAARGFDPNQRVRYGQASTDEMMMGFIMSSPVPEDERGTD
jgi:mono/diheme cytochrome c family protein